MVFVVVFIGVFVFVGFNVGKLGSDEGWIDVVEKIKIYVCVCSVDCWDVVVVCEMVWIEWEFYVYFECYYKMSFGCFFVGDCCDYVIVDEVCFLELKDYIDIGVELWCFCFM